MLLSREDLGFFPHRISEILGIMREFRVKICNRVKDFSVLQHDFCDGNLGASFHLEESQ